MPTLQTSRSRPIVFLGIAVIFAVLVLIAFNLFARDIVEVRVAEVSRGNLISSVSNNGKVEPIDPFYAHAAAPGVVEELFVDIGEKVKAGQLVVRMKDSDAAARLASAEATLHSAQLNAQQMQQGGTQEERIGMAGDIERAQLQQTQAQRDLAALRELQQKGAASASEVVSAQQRLASANSTLQSLQQRSTQRYSAADHDRAKAQIDDAQAALNAAKANYADTNIRTPISGTVYSLPVSEYDFVQAGEDLLDVADLNKIRIRGYFDEPDIGKLAQGQAVRIVWEAKPNQAWHGHIERVPTTIITYGTRNVGECLITVDDAHGDLLPNTNVTVTVTTSQRFNALNIPREALHTEGANDYVFRVVNSKLVRTPVQIGINNSTRVEIVSGLTDKDIVALTSTSNRDLSNGLAVKTVE
jgi:HlyD family secretion protein